MKIYTIEHNYNDSYESESDCVCATVDINVVRKYIKDNHLEDWCYYNVCVYDGFTGKITHFGKVELDEIGNLTSLNFVCADNDPK